MPSRAGFLYQDWGPGADSGGLKGWETVTFLASAALVYARTLAASGQEP